MIRVMTATTSALFAAAVVGCAGYGFVDDTDVAASAVAVHVEPIAAEAHLDLDTPAIRTHLVDELELNGIDTRGGQQAVSLRCAVRDYDSTGVGAGLVAELRLECDILPPGEDAARASLSATGIASDALHAGVQPPFAAAGAGRRVAARAAIDAVSQLAGQLDELVAGDQFDDSDTTPQH